MTYTSTASLNSLMRYSRQNLKELKKCVIFRFFFSNPFQDGNHAVVDLGTDQQSRTQKWQVLLEIGDFFWILLWITAVLLMVCCRKDGKHHNIPCPWRRKLKKRVTERLKPVVNAELTANIKRFLTFVTQSQNKTCQHSRMDLYFQFLCETLNFLYLN